ncbi:hypothetical protein [Yoonia litorea]|uniref:Uncharacterized protein n=1 Tax=Yoonia litorea TaxID=1123755 RepID=A0A1I6MJV6_9RHOB|nr:hypothetical protein [Yoonia litorea]SFS15908.1 hypothetical protein SAMN05444714_1925 [Yoonia litorea]
MTKKYEVRTTAERFIHNELSTCAWHFQGVANNKIETGEREGCALDMMAALVFCAFSVEAKVNFIGWKTLQDGWPERANLREKIDLLKKTLGLEIDWSQRPLQTIAQLKRFRDTLAHGKPEIVDETKVTDVEPEVWDALQAQWEKSVQQDFMNRCREDEDKLWEVLLSAAGIELHETLTSGGHSLTLLGSSEGRPSV